MVVVMAGASRISHWPDEHQQQRRRQNHITLHPCAMCVCVWYAPSFVRWVRRRRFYHSAPCSILTRRFILTRSWRDPQTWAVRATRSCPVYRDIGCAISSIVPYYVKFCFTTSMWCRQYLFVVFAWAIYKTPPLSPLWPLSCMFLRVLLNRQCYLSVRFTLPDWRPRANICQSMHADLVVITYLLPTLKVLL